MLGLRRSVWSHCSLAGLANLAVVASLSPRIVICKTGIVLGPASNGLNVKCLVQCVAVQAIHECMRAKLLKSYLTLCDSMDCSLPGSSVHGVLQARILQWVAVPFSRGSLAIGRQVQTYLFPDSGGVSHHSNMLTQNQ